LTAKPAPAITVAAVVQVGELVHFAVATRAGCGGPGLCRAEGDVARRGVRSKDFQLIDARFGAVVRMVDAEAHEAGFDRLEAIDVPARLHGGGGGGGGGGV